MAIYLPSRALDPRRRQLLRDLALGTAAFGLAGCGEQARAQAVGPGECPEDTDVLALDGNLLAAQLVMERLSVGAYHLYAHLLGEATLEVALLFASHHEAHGERAKAALIERGLSVPDAAYDPVPKVPESVPTNEVEVLRFASRLEMDVVKTYIGLAVQFGDPELRRQAAETLGSEVSHAVALNAAINAGEALTPEVIAAVGRAVAFEFANAIPPPDAPAGR